LDYARSGDTLIVWKLDGTADEEIARLRGRRGNT
jgi:hypothetical protein